MTNRLDALEGIVEQLAHEFATRLLEVALRSPITELSVLLRESAPVDAHALAVAVNRALPKLPARRASLVSASTTRAASRPSAASREAIAPKPPRPLGRGRARSFDAPPTDDADAAGTVITDPSLLLEVIGSGVAAGSRAPRPERGPSTQLLNAVSSVPPEARAATRVGGDPTNGAASAATTVIAKSAPAPVDQGPALRPGERLQRTAGGNVVLRRGVK